MYIITYCHVELIYMYNINIAHTHPIYFIDMKYNKEKIPLIFSLMVKAKFCLQGGGGIIIR